VEARGASNQGKVVVVSKAGIATTQTGSRVQTGIQTSNRETKTQVTKPGIKNNGALKLAPGFTPGVFYFCLITTNMSITVNNLTKIYGSQKAVDGISFNVNKGEIVGFLGPNGAGKSTTMKIITGYLQADDGMAEVCGRQVMDTDSETKKKVGYLPEANPLYYDMYVREYLDFISNVHVVKNKKQKIEEVIGQVGLAAEANKKIGQLSKGYKQRVGLAAALIHDPEVLILDEPTSGLDPNQIVEIREVIKKLGKEKTILFSSHILQEVQAICDRVVIINKGKIVADDDLSNLQKSKTGEHIVLVEFKESISADRLTGLSGITNMEQLEVTKYKLQTANPESVRKQLLELSLQNNWNIVSLQTESSSLEEVFRSLTNQPIN
jgi:ABC-2 type transport system ATP-binding protein